MYSCSKNCPNGWLFHKDWCSINQIHYIIIWKYYMLYYNILSFRNIFDHVIWIRTDVVISKMKHSIIGTVFWPSIYLHCFINRDTNSCSSGLKLSMGVVQPIINQNQVCKLPKIVASFSPILLWIPPLSLINFKTWFIFFKLAIHIK